MKYHKNTLEAAIAEYLEAYDGSARFGVRAYELTRDWGSLSVNDSWCILHDTDKAGVIEAARGRWEIFKLNYAPRARVKNIQDTGEGGEGHPIDLEVDCIAFLTIEPLQP